MVKALTAQSITDGKTKVKLPLDIEALKNAGDFTITFSDNKGVKCRLIIADAYNLIVEAGNRRLLIPKHSIKYILL